MKFKSIVSATALALVTGIASAGAVNPVPVEINFDARSAFGNMWTARTSLNPNEFIGCGVRYISIPAGTFQFGFCQAGIGALENEQFTCFTEDAFLIDAIKSISDYSFITFGWDADGNCIRIGNSTQSFYLPNHKTKS